MDWTVMAVPSPSQVPPQWNPRSPAPPRAGLLLLASASVGAPFDIISSNERTKISPTLVR